MFTRTSKSICLALALSCCVQFGLSIAASPTQMQREHIIAVMLWKFALFTEWPKQAEEFDDAFTFAILGKDQQLAQALDPYITKSIGDRPVVILQTGNPDQIKNVEVLFLNRRKPLSANQLKRFVAEGTLMVSTQPGFAASGGMVELVLTAGKNPQFEINQTVLHEAELEIRARVLTMARKVYAKKDPVVKP